MSDYISRADAIERVRKQMDRPPTMGSWKDYDEIANTCYNIVIKALKALPSADAVHGEWIDIDNYYRLATCSHCHKVTMFEKWGEYTKPYNFCPNCGARMTPYKGGDDE